MIVTALNDTLSLTGLAILMNTCCQRTQEHYSKFCAHVTAVATLDKDLVPVTNRYDIVESRLNCFMHGYVIDIPNSFSFKNVCVCVLSPSNFNISSCFLHHFFRFSFFHSFRHSIYL